MAKLAAMAAWICIVALGSLAGTQWLAHSKTGAEEDAKAARVPFESAILSLPVYKGASVEGYAILKFSGLADSELKESEQPPFNALQKHAAYLAIHKLAGSISFTEPSTKDTDRLKAELQDAINAIAQADRVGGIEIEQLDFLQRNKAAAKE